MTTNSSGRTLNHAAKAAKAELDRRRSLEQEIAALQGTLDLRQKLPHLHGYKWYPWARKFFESFNRLNFLTAANQVSKSSTAIRKNIRFATDAAVWEAAWGKKPKQFWYFYPSQKVLDAEWATKWSEFMPTDRNDPVYGWKEIKLHGVLQGIKFNSGVYLFFKFYSQSAIDLQTGTLDMLTADEEMPVDLWSELSARITASNGIFNMVFTATLGQEFWRLVMEPNIEEGEVEVMPNALKIQASLYDCMEYEDGTPSHWTPEKIAEVVARCKDQNEIDRRVMGRFVVSSEDKIFPTFAPGKHMIPPRAIPKGWFITTAVDIGTGGNAHPAAITFMAVNPEMTRAEVFVGWRGDGIRTDVGDIAEKFVFLKKSNALLPMIQLYDQASHDFFVAATSLGEGFKKSEKNHEKGEEIMNALLKNDMLFFHNTPEIAKISKELMTMRHATPKRHRKDDLTDTVRYQVCEFVWNFEAIVKRLAEAIPVKTVAQLSQEEQHLEDRRNRPADPLSVAESSIEQEFDDWNSLYEADHA
jgi:phage terminase large subunit-like protein